LDCLPAKAELGDAGGDINQERIRIDSEFWIEKTTSAFLHIGGFYYYLGRL